MKSNALGRFRGIPELVFVAALALGGGGSAAMAGSVTSLAGDQDYFGTNQPEGTPIFLSQLVVDSPAGIFDRPATGWCSVSQFSWSHVFTLPAGATVTSATLRIVTWDLEDNGAGDGLGGGPYDSRLYLDGVEVAGAFDDTFTPDGQPYPANANVFTLDATALAALGDGRLDVLLNTRGGERLDCVAVDHATLTVEFQVPPPTSCNTSCGAKKVSLCHNAGLPDAHAICISENAAPAHLAHGDRCGPCR